MSRLSEESRKINNFLRSINYNGIMSADFKRDPANGRLLLLEINARLWMHFWLPTKCGADIISASYLDTLCKNFEGYHKYVSGVKSICCFTDLRSSVKMIQQGEIGLSEYTASLLGRKVFSHFDRRDMLPFFRFYYSLAYKSIKDRITNLI